MANSVYEIRRAYASGKLERCALYNELLTTCTTNELIRELVAMIVDHTKVDTSHDKKETAKAQGPLS